MKFPFKENIKKAIYAVSVRFFKRYGDQIINSEDLYDWQKNPNTKPSYQRITSSEEAQKYLTENNSRYQDLIQRYSVFNKEVTLPFVWNDSIINTDDFKYFRGDNAYVWQLRGPNMNIMAYALTFYYLCHVDHLKLLDRLHEDDHFGNYSFEINGKVISRDLLDSLNELYFLERHLRLSVQMNFSILDIGAGYGRLAYRAVKAFPIENYLCTDAIAFSTFICEYYLRHRAVQEKAKTIPLDEVEAALDNYTPDLAVNIHSFSECTLSAINWWILLLSTKKIKYLFIVPNSGNHGGEKLHTNDGLDFEELIISNGYDLMVKEPKYLDPVVQKYAINPTYYYLFKLKAV